MAFSKIQALWCIAWSTWLWAQPLHAETPPPSLNVLVVKGFEPALRQILPRLQAQLPYHVNISSLEVDQINQWSSSTPPDVVINANFLAMKTAEHAGYLAPNSLAVIGQSDPVLWCPNPKINMRVRSIDTLSQANLRLAVPRSTQNPLYQAYEMLQANPAPQMVYTTGALSAWRAARLDKADCAITIRGLVSSKDRFQHLPMDDKTAAQFQVVAGIHKHAHQPEQAQQFINLLRQPVMRARIQRAGF